MRAGGLSERTVKEVEIKRESEVGRCLSCSVNMLHKTHPVQPIIKGSSSHLQCCLPTYSVTMHVGFSHTSAAGGHVHHTVFTYANRR